MRILRSIVAILAGFGFVASTVMFGNIIATAVLVPEGASTPAGESPASEMQPVYLVANVAVSAMGAVVGGWLAARIGAFAPFAHAAVLAAIVAVLSLATMLDAPAAPHPRWYPIVLSTIVVAGVLLGGKLRAAAAAADGPVVV
jgi:hypothetical protein